MTNHMEAAVKTVAKHMAETALDWTDVEADGHEHNLECTNWGAYTGDALTAIEEALPHIRAMIADEETAMRERRAWDEGFKAGWEEAKDPGAFVNDIWDAKTPNPY